MFTRFCFVIAALITLSACAFGDAELAIGYDAASAKKGLVSEVASSVVYVPDVQDERQDKVRIGFKRNGYGMKTADIHSEKPVPEIVREALQEMLRKNGHSIGGANQKVALKATVTNFWFDYKTGFWTVEFIGNTQIDVSLINQQTNETVFNEKFEGYYSEKSGGGLNKTWQRVMNAALNDLIQKINLSPDFKEALESLSQPSEATETGPGTS